eukprot:COSAG04_NODE_4309_length_2166_cov_30.188962_1_plen_104_part_10
MRERDSAGSTPLHRAAVCGAADGVRLLVAAGAGATAQDQGGRAAPHNAAYYGPDDPSLAGVLLAAGCDPAAKTTDWHKETALDRAKEKYKPRMTALLEAAEADP